MISPGTLQEALARVPRFPCTTLPTPLVALPRLAKALDVPDLLVKRDDLTGLAMGGNKARSLEFLVADALAQGADVFIAGGGVRQSNHARLCAAAAVQAGLHPVLVLRRGVHGEAVEGNFLITQLLGAEVHWIDDDPDMRDRKATSARMNEIAETYRRQGHRPYLLHSSLHPLGVLGYLVAGLELRQQLRDRGAVRATIFAPSEGVVLAGLLLTAALLGEPWEVAGVGWRPIEPHLGERLAALASAAAALLGLTSPLRARDFVVHDYGGPAYGEASDAGWDALTLCLRTEALLLDPIYTAKGMAGLIGELRAGRVTAGATPVFVHTGGLPALFARSQEVRSAVHERAVRPHDGRSPARAGGAAVDG